MVSAPWPARPRRTPWGCRRRGATSAATSGSMGFQRYLDGRLLPVPRGRHGQGAVRVGNSCGGREGLRKYKSARRPARSASWRRELPYGPASCRSEPGHAGTGGSSVTRSEIERETGHYALHGRAHGRAVPGRAVRAAGPGASGDVARLQLFGVIFGYQRVVIYVEPSTGRGGHGSPRHSRAPRS